MKMTILGSGGVTSIPRPTCRCRICAEARERGIPYSRTGSSMFIHDVNLLFDTPEEIRSQLNRENIKNVENVILTHWHPDHTLGLRILEIINFDFWNEKPFRKPIKVYISRYQLDMLKKLSCGGFLDFYENKRKCIKVIELKENQRLDFGKIMITPIKFEDTNGFYFIIEDGKHKIIYAPCEFKGFKVVKEARDADILIVHHLWSEDKKLMPKYENVRSWMKEEDSFEQMLKEAKNNKIWKIVIVHIEEIFEKSHDELNEIVKNKYKDYNIEFSFDGMEIIL